MRGKRKRWTTEERLEALYATLPKVACRGLCHEACGPIPLTRAEAGRLVAVAGERPMLSMSCPYLDAENRCAAYAVRPLICRIYGVVRALRCPHGCQPSRWLSDAEFAACVAQVERITGEGMDDWPMLVPDVGWADRGHGGDPGLIRILQGRR